MSVTLLVGDLNRLENENSYWNPGGHWMHPPVSAKYWPEVQLADVQGHSLSQMHSDNTEKNKKLV